MHQVFWQPRHFTDYNDDYELIKYQLDSRPVRIVAVLSP